MNNNVCHVVKGLGKKSLEKYMKFTVREGKRPFHVKENRIFAA